MLSKAIPCSDGPLAKSNDTPSHCNKENQLVGFDHWLDVEKFAVIYHDVNIFVQILARCGERF